MFKRLICIYICIMVMFINGCKNSIDNPIPEIKGKLSIIEGISILHVWGTAYEQGVTICQHDGAENDDFIFVYTSDRRA